MSLNAIMRELLNEHGIKALRRAMKYVELLHKEREGEAED